MASNFHSRSIISSVVAVTATIMTMARETNNLAGRLLIPNRRSWIQILLRKLATDISR